MVVIAAVMCCVNTKAHRSRLNSSPVQCLLTKVYRIPSVSGYQCSMTIATWLQVVDVFFSVSHSVCCKVTHVIGNAVMLLMAAMPDHFCMKPLKSWKQLPALSGAGFEQCSNAQFMVQKKCIYMYVRKGELYAISNRKYLYPAHLQYPLSCLG